MRFLKRFTRFALTSTSIIVAAENGGLPLDLSSTDEINQKAGLPNLIIPSDNSESISLQSSPLSEIVLTPPNNTPNRVPSSDNEEDDKQQEIVENFSNDGSFDEIPLTLDSTTSVTKNEDDNSIFISLHQHLKIIHHKFLFLLKLLFLKNLLTIQLSQLPPH